MIYYVQIFFVWYTKKETALLASYLQPWFCGDWCCWFSCTSAIVYLWLFLNHIANVSQSLWSTLWFSFTVWLVGRWLAGFRCHQQNVRLLFFHMKESQQLDFLPRVLVRYRCTSGIPAAATSWIVIVDYDRGLWLQLDCLDIQFAYSHTLLYIATITIVISDPFMSVRNIKHIKHWYTSPFIWDTVSMCLILTLFICLWIRRFLKLLSWKISWGNIFKLCCSCFFSAGEHWLRGVCEFWKVVTSPRFQFNWIRHYVL